MTTTIIYILIALFVVIPLIYNIFIAIKKLCNSTRELVMKITEDFAQKFARIFTHVYRNHEEGFQLALSTKSDRGKTLFLAEKTIESVLGDEITHSEIGDIIDASFRDNELALDELIVHSFAKMIVMARGGSVETIEQGLFRDKHDKILKGIKAADKEVKRGYVPREASELLKKSSERRITNLMKRELSAMQSLGLFNAPTQHSRKHSSNSIGEKISNIVLTALKTSEGYKFSEYTFTELFAFAYFELDSVLSARKNPSRATISKSLSLAYSDTMESEFKVKDGERHTTILNSRIQKYAEDLNSGKEKSEIIDGLSFYLDQASLKDDYQVLGEPVMMGGDFFASMSGKRELQQFYLSSLTPIIKETISK